MSEPSGVLYTEHAALAARTPIASLWSYRTRVRDRGRPSVVATPDGSREYWLDRSDPLLNTILPGTHVSLVVNFGDAWAAGHSLMTSAQLPRACVVGPVTRSRILRVGREVRALGAALPPTLARDVFGAPAAALVDRIVPLDELWGRDDAERLVEWLLDALARESAMRGLTALRDALLARVALSGGAEPVARTAPPLIERRAGRVRIDDLARGHGLGRREFGRRFAAAAGVSPKLYARVTRFQALVHALLSTDVARWASLPESLGFYDQAHMTNEFRAFAGSPPTLFFRPHGGEVDPASVRPRGRPCEWLRAPAPGTGPRGGGLV